MNYSTIIKEVLENTNQERNDRNIISSIKHDIEKTVRDMFTNAEAPIRSESFNLDEYISDSVTDDVILSPTTLVYTHTEVIKSMSGLNIKATNQSDILPIITNSLLNVNIVSSTGEVLLDTNVNVVNDTLLDEDIDIVFNDVVGATLTVTAVMGIDIDTIIISNISWDKSFTSLELPEYVYVPLGATFKVGKLHNSVGYLSKEMTEEEYNRWVPLGAIKEVDANSPITSIDANPATVVYSLENLEFDNRIGYFFSVVNEKLYLIFKPAVVGVVTIRFSYIPQQTIVEENQVPIHQAFINGIIDGTTIRQLQKLMLKVKDELQLITIKSVMSTYLPHYDKAVSRFAGYNRKKTEVRSIKMFGIVDDTSMMLN